MVPHASCVSSLSFSQARGIAHIFAAQHGHRQHFVRCLGDQQLSRRQHLNSEFIERQALGLDLRFLEQNRSLLAERNMI